MIGRGRARAVIGVIILMLMGVSGALAAAELALRAMGLGDPIVYRANTAYRYAPRPDQRVNRRRGAWISINESGYRSTESWKKPAAFKVLWLGDSVTWGGTYIDDRETFAELSCDRIEEETSLEAVCGNGGVNAYGVDNMVSRLRYDRAGDSANVIVVVAGLFDFFRGKSNLSGKPWVTSPPPGPVRALWSLSIYQTSLVLAFLQRGGGRGSSCDEAYGPAVARESLEELLQVLNEKQDEGTTVLLVRSPAARETVDAVDLSPRPRCIAGASELLPGLEEAIRASGVPYLDLTNAAREAAKADPAEPFFHDHVHLEVRGHRVYAHEISERLIELLSSRRTDSNR